MERDLVFFQRDFRPFSRFNAPRLQLREYRNRLDSRLACLAGGKIIVRDTFLLDTMMDRHDDGSSRMFPTKGDDPLRASTQKLGEQETNKELYAPGGCLATSPLALPCEFVYRCAYE